MALLLLVPIACNRGTLDETSLALKARLEAPPPAIDARTLSAKRWKEVVAFYGSNGLRPIWFDEGGPRPAAKEFQAVVEAASAHGLNPASYKLGALPALSLRRSRNPFRSPQLDPGALAEAEVRLSYAFFTYVGHLQRGQVDARMLSKHWLEPPQREDLGRILTAAVERDRVPEMLADQAPRHPEYQALKEGLARYREIVARGGWPPLPARLALKPGKADPRVALLRQRLAASGDLAAAPPAPGAVHLFDPETGEAVKRFERRHGLPEDGLLDAEALAAMNVPVEERIRQIELNLERWRWLPQALGESHIFVNVPTFTLTAFEHGRPALEMRVVTGKPESPTPIFSDEMTTVVFSPYWNVPPDIAREETIPAVMHDPSYLDKNNLEVLRGTRVVDPRSVDLTDPEVRIRQRPGPQNALGHVKFMFPNKFDVYLHDTPADSLFASIDRGYSHGCVRVEKPYELARWVLRGDSRWTAERIQAAMDSGEEQHVALKEKIPVYIAYKTVWVDGEGTVHFRDDIYGHDGQQERILPPSPLPAKPVRVAAR